MLDIIRKAATRARKTGSLLSIPTSYEVLTQPGTSIQFLIRILANLRRKDEAKNASESDEKKQNSSSLNPFLPYDPDMFVEHTTPTHVCLLNKYNVVDDHILLVTREYEEQSSLLTFADFLAMWRCMVRLDALAFYNAGEVAGASQRHKHLQLVPTPLIPDSRDRVPFDEILCRKASTSQGFSAPELPFVHRAANMSECAALAESTNDLSKAAELSMERYTSLLHALSREPCLLPLQGITDGSRNTNDQQPFPYNLLVTREWMLMVPRSKEKWQGISINALGFAGSLFVRDAGERHLVEQLGPMKLLQHVAFPLD